jgi:FtsZ-binding cell division protein ZapB
MNKVKCKIIISDKDQYKVIETINFIQNLDIESELIEPNQILFQSVTKAKNAYNQFMHHYRTHLKNEWETREFDKNNLKTKQSPPTFTPIKINRK